MWSWSMLGASYLGTAHHTIQLCCKSCSFAFAGLLGLSCHVCHCSFALLPLLRRLLVVRKLFARKLLISRQARSKLLHCRLHSAAVHALSYKSLTFGPSRQFARLLFDSPSTVATNARRHAEDHHPLSRTRRSRPPASRRSSRPGITIFGILIAYRSSWDGRSLNVRFCTYVVRLL